MTRVIAVANLKGGTGKSTTVANLACVWGRNRPVLAVDLDPQADLTAMFGLYPEDVVVTIDDVFLGRDLLEATVADVAPGVDLVAAGPKLAAVEVTLFGQMSREQFLADAFEGQLDAYDVVLVDCPPQLGTLTPNALFAASEVLIPVAMTDRGAYNGAAELLAKVDEVRTPSAHRHRPCADPRSTAADALTRPSTERWPISARLWHGPRSHCEPPFTMPESLAARSLLRLRIAQAASPTGGSHRNSTSCR